MIMRFLFLSFLGACSRTDLLPALQEHVPEATALPPSCESMERASNGPWAVDLELLFALETGVARCESRDAPCVESPGTRSRKLAWNAPFVVNDVEHVSAMAGLYRKEGVLIFDVLGANSWARVLVVQDGGDWASVSRVAAQPLMPGATSISATLSTTLFPARLKAAVCRLGNCFDSEVEFSDQGIRIGPSNEGDFAAIPADRLARLPGRERIVLRSGDRFAISDEAGALIACGMF